MATLRLETLPETGTVSVACKLPHGLRLELPVSEQAEADRDNAYRASLKNGQAPVAYRVEEEVFATIKGWSVPFGSVTILPGGFAVTSGVDAQKFKRWYERMLKAKYGPVVNGQIFACAKSDVAADKAAEHASIAQINARLSQANLPAGIQKEDAR